jgi:hypothetical protein
MLKTAIAKCYVKDGLTTGSGLHVTLCCFDNNQTNMQLRDLEQRVVED